MTPSEVSGLSLTEWVVLSILAEAPAHGFAVARILHRATPLGQVWSVARPLVYRAIDRVEEQGLIAEVGEEPGEPGPRRILYAATEEGRVAAALWRAEPVKHLREVRSAFLAKVLLRERVDEPLAPLLAAQRAVFAPLFESLTEYAAGDEAERVVAAWRYESSQAAARLLDFLETREGGHGADLRARPGSTVEGSNLRTV